MSISEALLSGSEFLPHGLCLVWQPTLILLHTVSDAVTALSYYSMPAALVFFALRRRDFPFRLLLVGFGIFIFACGTTHVLAVVTLWQPVYWLEGWVKMITAVTSVATAAVLWPLLPRALALPSPTQLSRLNAELEAQVAERRGAENTVRTLNAALEERVHQRTAELEQANAALRAEIDQRTAVEDALRQSRELLRAMIDNSTAVIFVKDLEGRYLLINRQYSELFHIGQTEILGRTDYDIFPSDVADAFRAADRQVLACGAAIQTEEIAPHDDGLHTYVVIKYPLHDRQGHPYAVGGIATDITERRQAEAERQARQAAEAANRAKSQFLANMSHELRTPLNAVLGYAQILKRDPGLTERQAAGLDTIQQSGQHLLTLINDLLDLAKIEAGKLELCPQPLTLTTFLPVVADIVRVKAEEKSLLFVYDAVPDLSRVVEADEKRLRQVLLNLLSNAVKFTDRGQVRLAVQVLGRDASGVRLRFEVTDSGVGMAPEALDAIFLPFEQVGEIQRRAGGTGLGLAISRQLVRLMGGEIQVDSRPGQGSRFWFDVTLPVLAAAAAARPADRVVAGYDGPRQTVLIADDVVGNRALLADLLGGLGFAVCEASNGRGAIEQVVAAAPDLVLMDLVMPVMDGVEAMRRLRQMPEGQHLPIIAISASANQDDQAASLAAGANAFLAKPIDQNGLLDKVAHCLGLTWTYAAQGESGPMPADEAAPLIIPPREEMDALHRLALLGDMRAIRLGVAQLADRDERYRPFADRIVRLAQGYQSKALLGLVEQHLAVRTPP